MVLVGTFIYPWNTLATPDWELRQGPRKSIDAWTTEISALITVSAHQPTSVVGC